MATATATATRSRSAPIQPTPAVTLDTSRRLPLTVRRIERKGSVERRRASGSCLRRRRRRCRPHLGRASDEGSPGEDDDRNQEEPHAGRHITRGRLNSTPRGPYSSEPRKFRGDFLDRLCVICVPYMKMPPTRRKRGHRPRSGRAVTCARALLFPLLTVLACSSSEKGAGAPSAGGSGGTAGSPGAGGSPATGGSVTRGSGGEASPRGDASSDRGDGTGGGAGSANGAADAADVRVGVAISDARNEEASAPR